MLSVSTAAITQQRALKCLEKLPKLSPLRTQLVSRVARRNCEISDLSELIEKDAVLSAQVLRLANSAMFGRIQPIHSIRRAVAYVGIGTMRKFALGSSIANLFSRFKLAPSFSMARFNVHSVATASLVELLAEEVPVEFSSGAFIAGLMHDVGKLLIAVGMPQEYEDILAISATNGAPLIESERQVLGTDHAELSALVIAHWDLPEPVLKAARHHHDSGPELGFSPKFDLSLAIHKADAFVNYLGMSVLPPGPQPEEPPNLEFGSSHSSSQRVLQRFELELKSLTDLFGQH